MSGQIMSDAQAATVARLRAKGWRLGDVVALQAVLYYDRPFVGLPKPHVIHVDRAGRVHRGWATRGKNGRRVSAKGA